MVSANIILNGRDEGFHQMLINIWDPELRYVVNIFN